VWALLFVLMCMQTVVYAGCKLKLWLCDAGIYYMHACRLCMYADVT